MLSFLITAMNSWLVWVSTTVGVSLPLQGQKRWHCPTPKWPQLPFFFYLNSSSTNIHQWEKNVAFFSALHWNWMHPSLSQWPLIKAARLRLKCCECRTVTCIPCAWGRLTVGDNERVVMHVALLCLQDRGHIEGTQFRMTAPVLAQQACESASFSSLIALAFCPPSYWFPCSSQTLLCLPCFSPRTTKAPSILVLPWSYLY